MLTNLESRSNLFEYKFFIYSKQLHVHICLLWHATVVVDWLSTTKSSPVDKYELSIFIVVLERASKIEAIKIDNSYLSTCDKYKSSSIPAIGQRRHWLQQRWILRHSAGTRDLLLWLLLKQDHIWQHLKQTETPVIKSMYCLNNSGFATYFEIWTFP